MRIGGFPKSKAVKLRYVEYFSMNPATGIPAVQVYSANGMYDPNITGTGHQPSNYDRWLSTATTTGIYDHYTVLGSKIRVVPVVGATTTQTPLICGILLTDDGATVAGMSQTDLLEQPGTVYSRYPFGNDLNMTRSIRHRFSARKFFGKSKGSLIGDGQYKGAWNSNPSEGAFFEIFATDVCGNEPPSMCFYVEIVYYAILTEPKEALAS